MFRIFMLTIWALGAIFLIHSYFAGIPQMGNFQAIATDSMKDLLNAGPYANARNMSDLPFYYHFGAFLIFFVYLIFTKQILKEFGPQKKV